MARKLPARVGKNGEEAGKKYDKTSHGGVAITGNPNYMIDGLPMLRTGDKAFCPIHSPHIFDIIGTGFPVDDTISVVEGDLTTCGAVILAEEASPEMIKHALRDHSKDYAYDQRFKVLNEATGEPSANRKYRITYSGGVVESTTDENGMTTAIKSDTAETIKLEVF
jgi:uncharacterized Zn-binding protein involved in type VI secretion